MKPIHKTNLISLASLTFVFFFAFDAFALEEASTGRKVWDNIMLFVNFGILVFLFVKYAKKPLMQFLRSERESVEKQINILTSKKQGAQSQKDAEAEQIKDIDRIIEEIRNSIIEMGEREKEKIIRQGKSLAEKMIRDAEAYSESRIIAARQELSEEMVDLALSMAREKLQKNITEKDNDHLVDRFITNLQATKPSVD
ncbi:MAG: ATP synthase F0 subunit B [Deltaproteobacteria bacterium]|nr:ATP synthase F0 subunit B [Deltaproteobacteria bacterium]